MVFCLMLGEGDPGPFGGGLFFAKWCSQHLQGENGTWISGEFHHIHLGGTGAPEDGTKRQLDTKGPSHGRDLMLKGSPAGGTAIRRAGVEQDRLRPTPK